MWITSLNLPETASGLSAIKMSGMNGLVLLAGPNGGGKSRILNEIKMAADGIIDSNQLDAFEERLRDVEGAINDAKNYVSKFSGNIGSEHAKTVKNYQINISHWEREKSDILRKIEISSRIKTSMPGMKPVVVAYGFGSQAMQDWKAMTMINVRKKATNVSGVLNSSNVTTGGLSAIRDLIERVAFSRQGKMKEADDYEEKLEKFKEIVRDLLGAELSWDSTGDPCIFGLPVSSAGLSHGQWILLQIAVSIFFQDGSKDELILLWDEPENHLHPSALLNVVEKVREKCPTVQIWIATHSLSLLAHYDSSNLWFVKEGRVEYAGPKTLEVINSLVGDESGIDEIFSFLALPAKTASNLFAAQCLFPPAVLDTAPGDPQTKQIVAALDSARNSNGVRILDWGMGKGRLLGEIELLSKEAGVHLCDAFDYFGYEPFSDEQGALLCLSKLESHFHDAESRYLRTEEELISRVDEAGFDFVVMCNVLHEIPPEEWVRLFGERGLVSRLLKTEGFLLVVEDQILPVGERAHRFGCLVLDEYELRLLVGVTNQDSAFITTKHADSKYRDRLKAHKIPASMLRNVTTATRKRAVEGLRDRSLTRIRDIQKVKPDHRAGRQYAFWVHQHVNATLALEYL